MRSSLRHWLILVGLAAVLAATLSGLSAREDRDLFDLTHNFAAHFSLHSPSEQPLDQTQALVPPVGANSVRPPPPYPGAAIASIPFHYAALVTGVFTGKDETSADAWTELVTQSAAAGATAASAFLLFLIALEMGCRPKAARLAMLSFAFASVALPYASRLAEPTFATLVILLFYYTYLRLRGDIARTHHVLGLGLSLFLAPLTSRLTLTLFPLFLLLVLSNYKKVFAGKLRPILALAPAVFGAIIFMSYNAAAFGGAFLGADGRQVFAALFDFPIRPSLGQDTLRLLLTGYARLRSIIPEPLFYYSPAAGFLVAMPQLALALFGILNLRAEKLTRRPLYLLLLIAILNFAIVATRPGYLGSAYDVGILLPMTALLFVLLGSFVEYHLMTMRGIVFKPLFWLLFIYLSLRAFLNTLSAVMAHAAAQKGLPLLFQIPAIGKQGSYISELMRVVKQVFPSLANLPVLLPIAAFFLILPFVAKHLLSRPEKKSAAIKPPEPAPPSEPPPKREPRTDRERYEADLEEIAKKKRQAFPVWGDGKDPGKDGDGWVH